MSDVFKDEVEKVVSEDKARADQRAAAQRASKEAEELARAYWPEFIKTLRCEIDAANEILKSNDQGMDFVLRPENEQSGSIGKVNLVLRTRNDGEISRVLGAFSDGRFIGTNGPWKLLRQIGSDEIQMILKELYSEIREKKRRLTMGER